MLMVLMIQNHQHLAFLEGHIDGFNAGAKWAINKFLKDLWHPASEEPITTSKENEYVECLVKFKDGFVNLYNYDTWKHWWVCDYDNEAFLGKITCWLYIDDLFPKEGGNHD